MMSGLGGATSKMTALPKRRAKKGGAVVGGATETHQQGLSAAGEGTAAATARDPFIVTTPSSANRKLDEASRRYIRSHVMLGKNKKRPAARAAAAAAAAAATTDSNSTGVASQTDSGLTSLP